MEPHFFTAVDALIAIWSRRKLVILFFLATLVTTVLVTILSEKSYKSDAKLLVRLGRENSALDVTAGLGENQVYALPINRDSEINSIAEMIDNRDLYGRVVDKVGVDAILKINQPGDNADDREDSGPGIVDRLMEILTDIGLRTEVPLREKAIIKLQKKMDIETAEDSNVVSISFETYDPKLAQNVVSEVVHEYRKQHARAHRSQGGTEFLKAEVEKVREDLARREQGFEDFKTRTGLISVEDQRKVMVERIARIKNELLDVNARIESVKSEVTARQESTSSMDKFQALSTTEGAGNEGIDGMRQELFRLQVRYEELTAKYSQQHPSVVQIKSQLQAAQQLFNQAAADLVEVVEGPSNLFEGALMELIRLEPTLTGLRSKATALENQLAGVVAELNAFNEQETEFLRLRREITLADENFKRYSRILQQASLDYSLQENDMSNLTVFQPATFSLKPYRPKKLLNLLIGMFAGITGGCSLAVLLGYRRAWLTHREAQTALTTPGPATAELEMMLDLPVVAHIPRQPQRLFSNSE